MRLKLKPYYKAWWILTWILRNSRYFCMTQIWRQTDTFSTIMRRWCWNASSVNHCNTGNTVRTRGMVRQNLSRIINIISKMFYTIIICGKIQFLKYSCDIRFSQESREHVEFHLIHSKPIKFFQLQNYLKHILLVWSTTPNFEHFSAKIYFTSNRI